MSLSAAILPARGSSAFMKARAGTDDRILDIDADLVRRVTIADVCPPDQLPILAWEYSVDEWVPAWSDAQKRNAINVSFDIHRYKGTSYAVDTAVATLGHSSVIEEWFEYGGHPYRFRVNVNLAPEQVFTQEQIDQVVRVALRTKNVRSYLEYLQFKRTTTVPLSVGAALHSRVITTIGPFLTTQITVRPYAFVAAVVTSKSIVTIYPGA